MKDTIKKIIWFIFFAFCVFIVIACVLEKQKDFWAYFYMLLFFVLACVSIYKIKVKKEMSPDKKKALAKHISQNIDSCVEDAFKEVASQPEQEFETVDMLDSGFEDYPTFAMSYMDSNGSTTKRNIILKSMTLKDDRVYLNAFCLLRNEDRMFLTDRIKRISYQNEVISQPVQYFHDIFMNSNGYALYTVMQSKADIFKLFMFLAKADGKIAKSETEIIVEYIKKLLPTISDKSAENAVKNIPLVNIAEFYSIIKKMKKEPADNAVVLEYYKKLYDLKKNPDPLEKGIFEKVTASLGL